jgi:hypothetical protein
VPGATEIPDYEPEDSAWGVVIGPFIRPPAEGEQPEHDDDIDSGDDAQEQRPPT